jgi:hypothetical protein
MTPDQRLEAVIRMSGRTDGRLSFSWLNAVRETVIDGEVRPFCRVLAAQLNDFRMGPNATCKTTIIESTFYLDYETGELLDTLAMPVTGKVVKVPHYRHGPALVNLGATLDEWEMNVPGTPDGTKAAFAPKGAVHLERSVGQPFIQDGWLHLRHEEYGRVYADRSKPVDPLVSYRAWMIWHARARDVLQTRTPSVDATFSYAAISSWRPWMEMGEVKGHTTENGYGAKVQTAAELPDQLKVLLRARDPEILDNPAKMLGERK